MLLVNEAEPLLHVDVYKKAPFSPPYEFYYF